MSDRSPRNRAPRRRPDRVRQVAYRVIRQVNGEDGYANLVLNKALRDERLGGRDAAFCTELVHGTLRWQGTYDAFLARGVSRPLDELDPELLDLLRLGTHQLLRMRVDTYAAVDEMVTLTRAEVGHKRSGLVNAVLRKISQRSLDQWIAAVAPPADDDLLGHLAIAKAHPRWIIEAFGQALARVSDEPGPASPGGLTELLNADNEPPRVTLAARPGLGTVDDLVRAGAIRAQWSPLAAVLPSGDPGRIDAVAGGRAGVQDEGSQLVALALANAPLEGSDASWLDLCAGPGGKAALLAAILNQRTNAANEHARQADLVGRAELLDSPQRGTHECGPTATASTNQPAGRIATEQISSPGQPVGRTATESGGTAQSARPSGLTATESGGGPGQPARPSGLTAIEPLKHRAELVRSNLRAIPGEHRVLVGDGTKPTWPAGSYDRVLADVPCSGLGALRRRPEARWRRTPQDVLDLRPLQEDLLDSAITSVRPGGVVAYVTCSPHPDETRAVVDTILSRRDDVQLEDARDLFPGVPDLGPGPDVQLWPHLHGTDAMYLALLRRS